MLFIFSFIESIISFSAFLRSLFSLSSSFASISASCSLSVSRSFAARDGEPNLPDAFILGAIPKARDVDVIGDFSPLFLIRALIPHLSELTKS